MKQFSFKLEPVLAYRKLLEEGEEQKLREIRAAVLEVQKLRDNLEIEIVDDTRALQESTQGTIDIERVRHLSAYLEQLRKHLVNASIQLSKLEQSLRIQVEKLMEARRSREVVEKLKEKSLALHERELEALERKVHDELAVTQFGRFDKQELPTTDSDS